MIVTEANLNVAFARLAARTQLALDTETTGLVWHKDDRLFSIVIADAEGGTYWNFQEYDDAAALPRSVFERLQREVFSRDDIYWYLFNAKFDMHMLANEGLSLAGKIHCVQAFERLVENKRAEKGGYSLAEVAGYHGFEKSDEVDRYVAKNKLYTFVDHEGVKKRTKLLHYDRVPFPVIVPYGITDGEITLGTGRMQRTALSNFSSSFADGGTRDLQVKLAENERQLTKVCFAIERQGMRIDRGYCEKAFQVSRGRAQTAAEAFERATGTPLVDDKTTMPKILRAAGVMPGRTAPTKRFPEGQDSFNKAALMASEHPAAEALLEYRRNSKVAGTYFRAFLDLADKNDRIHTDLRQAGTDTGRFSSSNPNLQNLKKNEKDDVLGTREEDSLDDEEKYHVRRCFIPPPGFCLVSIDYDQQEYRMALDCANETGLIDKVLGGLDVHTATAEMAKVSREHAKALNFLLIYGGGVARFAAASGMSLVDAGRVRSGYIASVEKLFAFTRLVIKEAERRGFILNWAGRRYSFDRDSAYKAPNAYIQGGCADVMRFAMVRLAEYLAGRLSCQVITVHDEILFEVHESELSIVPELAAIMENVYPAKRLKLTCSVSHSWTSWADKKKGPPI